jgi:three-Cys-motif partner protein
MGLNRLLKKDGKLPKEWEDTLDRFLGTTEWRSEFYAIEETPDLFEGSKAKTVKSASTEKFEKFILARLRTIFPIVLDKGVTLTNSKGQTMYLLCFASANPSPKVKALATKLARWATEA